MMKAHRYEPAPRCRHKTVVVGGNLYMWAGLPDKNGLTHDCEEKREFASSVEMFHPETGDWIKKQTSRTPPLGIGGYACAAVNDELHYFGGYCGHTGCYHNSVHKLSTTSLEWAMLYPTTSEDGAPMKKAFCDMVAFKDGEENILFVVGGFGGTPLFRQPGAEYKQHYAGVTVRCNEQHMFTLSTREWSSPSVTGQPLPPCDDFTLTLLDEKRAAVFGGEKKSGLLDDLLIVELSRDTVHWTKFSNPVTRPVIWPDKRQGHAACALSGPLLVIMGGKNNEDELICDSWIYDFTTKLWKKLSLPDTVTKRIWHSVSSLQLSSHCVWLIVFGGRKSPEDINSRISHTAIIELTLGGDGHWKVKRVFEGEALVSKYQQMLSEHGRKGLAADNESNVDHHLCQHTIRQLEEQNRQLQLDQEVQAARQLCLMRTNSEENQPHWVVSREEVEVTDELLGSGGWAEVRIAKFRGLQVAAKCLHQVILSDYNIQQFTREMTIAAKLRHPNLLLFIGATREGEPVILTELMPTSLRKELEKREIPRSDIIAISQDVVRALLYLHQWKPSPIIHRDISSGNVLLEPLRNGWRAKVSDYGSANFMNAVKTVGPGSPAYAAPEACFPDQHCPKMDVFSFGVLLVEMCLRQLPESDRAQREVQIQCIQWPTMVSLVRQCTSENASDRPNTSDIMKLLGRI